MLKLAMLFLILGALVLGGCGGSSDPAPHLNPVQARAARAKALTAKFYRVQKEGKEAEHPIENAAWSGDHKAQEAGEAVERRTLREARAIVRQMHGLVEVEKARVGASR